MFYLIDKPLNYTSFDVLRVLRKKLNIKKMGHTGTLDPLATGGLLIAIGNYTKLIPYFEKDIKEYIFEVNFDGVSESYDLGTQVNYITDFEKNIAKQNITSQKINNILIRKFTGQIEQIPPKYSALKIDGKKAIDMIIKGNSDFEMKKRTCFIYEIELLSFSYPTAKIRAKVSAGTYIRTIAFDLGNILGTGGYVINLRRTKIGNLDLSYSQKLEDFEKNNFLDLKTLFKNNNFIELDLDSIKELDLGRKIISKTTHNIGEELFIFDGKNVTNIVVYDGVFLIPKRKI
ncbi:MAG: tRNA pseudouridine(55) synthase TruB [Candidatus Gracilibacteria bacterium]|nr:tRNA pseudouridine(55) synthase TruB [Candidatus Gracilibacteria bacterium]